MPNIVSSEEMKSIILSWNKENPEAVLEAEKEFIKYIRKGWMAFAVSSNDKKAQIFTFKPESEEIHLFPFIEGG